MDVLAQPPRFSMSELALAFGRSKLLSTTLTLLLKRHRPANTLHSELFRRLTNPPDLASAPKQIIGLDLAYIQPASYVLCAI